MPKGEVDLCCGLNVKCGPHRLVCLNTWVPAGGSIWDGCGSYRRWSHTRGSRSLGVGLDSLAHFLLPLCFLTIDAM